MGHKRINTRYETMTVIQRRTCCDTYRYAQVPIQFLKTKLVHKTEIGTDLLKTLAHAEYSKGIESGIMQLCLCP